MKERPEITPEANGKGSNHGNRPREVDFHLMLQKESCTQQMSLTYQSDRILFSIIDRIIPQKPTVTLIGRITAPEAASPQPPCDDKSRNTLEKRQDKHLWSPWGRLGSDSTRAARQGASAAW
jgi:hypothetical protein